jgi:hypothetical protein
LIEVDFAVGVEDGLATTRQWGVFEEVAVQLLLWGVVEGRGDGALALQDLAAGSDVVDEAHGVDILDLLSHQLLLYNKFQELTFIFASDIAFSCLIQYCYVTATHPFIFE